MKKRSYKSPDILFVNLVRQDVITGSNPGEGGQGEGDFANQRGTSIWDD